MKILKIQHPILDDSRITYGFFTRSGGISKKPYDTLNCSFNNEDASITIIRSHALFQNIRPIGEDIARGDMIIPRNKKATTT